MQIPKGTGGLAEMISLAEQAREIAEKCWALYTICVYYDIRKKVFDAHDGSYHHVAFQFNNNFNSVQDLTENLLSCMKEYCVPVKVEYVEK